MPTAIDSNAVMESERKYELWRVREGLKRDIDSGDESPGGKWTDHFHARSFSAALLGQVGSTAKGGPVKASATLTSLGEAEAISKATELRRTPTSQSRVERRRITDGRELKMGQNISMGPLPFEGGRTRDLHAGYIHKLDAEKLAVCEKEKREIFDQLRRTITKLELSEQRTRDLEAQVGRLSEELKVKDTKLRQTEGQYQTTIRILEETALELKGANLFLTKEDTISSADVISMVDDVNAEIMHIAAFMAEMLDDRGRGQERERQGKTAERKFNLQAMGEPLVQLLRQSTTQSLDPMTIQIALQLSLAETCAIIVGSWFPGVWKGEDVLWKVYSSLKKSAAQAVIGRWRAITRSQTKYEDCHSPVLLYMIRRVEDVLSLAGWPKHRPENSRLLEQFEEKLDGLVTMALRLHRALGEDIVSGELKAQFIYPNTRFDEMAMDEAFQGEQGIIDGMSGNQVDVLRKPKVVLATVLEDMLGKQS
ncbi:hypothetical protein DXG03_008708 [Asterophora parasitica]|uniref:Uncharacterized protein n=1 Tax=Asterophora parasitica TaxID=117018 RepID=A0A9P7GBL2_9AGAR|nr:hypothetical protein DXG03_008708 [Asterophora parasitica]